MHRALRGLRLLQPCALRVSAVRVSALGLASFGPAPFPAPRLHPANAAFILSSAASPAPDFTAARANSTPSSKLLARAPTYSAAAALSATAAIAPFSPSPRSTSSTTSALYDGDPPARSSGPAAPKRSEERRVGNECRS